ncbi:hypothetical protein, partial [Mesorhizobium sp.]|uniref:hypothetical protein n=1 Tax=Mesorhizobium sp. TaxID=1871066 RepID=UPI0025E7E846
GRRRRLQSLHRPRRLQNQRLLRRQHLLRHLLSQHLLRRPHQPRSDRLLTSNAERPAEKRAVLR